MLVKSEVIKRIDVMGMVDHIREGSMLRQILFFL